MMNILLLASFCLSRKTAFDHISDTIAVDFHHVSSILLPEEEGELAIVGFGKGHGNTCVGGNH